MTYKVDVDATTGLTETAFELPAGTSIQVGSNKIDLVEDTPVRTLGDVSFDGVVELIAGANPNADLSKYAHPETVVADDGTKTVYDVTYGVGGRKDSVLHVDAPKKAPAASTSPTPAATAPAKDDK
jgi:hypothetical protein